MTTKLAIGKIKLSSNLCLAPLAGFTDIAFRRLCREAGAGLTATEMVSVRGLCHGNEKTRELLRTADGETPSCVQLFGNNPNDFSAAMRSGALTDFDIIDINMGCPMPKIAGNGDGSALLSDSVLAGKIVEACVQSGRPVTVKVRLGITDKSNALAFCKALESAGAAMIAVHGRTAKQMYTGLADWDAIGNIASALTIPVVGNGDIRTPEDIAEKLKLYPVAGLMIGRGALGNPWIFGGQHRRQSVKQTMLRHLEYSLSYFPERYAVTTLRKHFVWYLKGLPGVRVLKEKLVGAETAEIARTLISEAQIP